MRGIVKSRQNNNLNNNSDLEDIIREYTVSADGNISAGDLCEFINGEVRKTQYSSTNTLKTILNNVNSEYITSCLLDDTHILVAYCTPNLTALVLTIDNNNATISVGTPLQINSLDSSQLNICTIDSNRAALVYQYYQTGVYYGASIILTVSGSTISSGTITQISSSDIYFPSLCLLDNTHMLVTLGSTINKYNRAYILTISGTTITRGTENVLDNCFLRPYYTELCKIDSSRVMYSYHNSNTNYLIATILTINSDVITMGTISNISYSSSTSDNAKMCLLNENNIFMAYKQNSNNLYVGTINFQGDTIKSSKFIDAVSINACNIGINRIDYNHVFVTYSENGTRYCAFIATILDNFTVQKETVNYITTYSNADSITSWLLPHNNIMIIYRQLQSSPCYGVAQIFGTKDNIVSDNAVLRELNPMMVGLNNATVGNSVKCLIKGICKISIGLIPNNIYYCDNEGNLTTSKKNIQIGTAISDSELLIKLGYWER